MQRFHRGDGNIDIRFVMPRFPDSRVCFFSMGQGRLADFGAYTIADQRLRNQLRKRRATTKSYIDIPEHVAILGCITLPNANSGYLIRIFVSMSRAPTCALFGNIRPKT